MFSKVWNVSNNTSPAFLWCAGQSQLSASTKKSTPPGMGPIWHEQGAISTVFPKECNFKIIHLKRVNILTQFSAVLSERCQAIKFSLFIFIEMFFSQTCHIQWAHCRHQACLLHCTRSGRGGTSILFEAVRLFLHSHIYNARTQLLFSFNFFGRGILNFDTIPANYHQRVPPADEGSSESRQS